MKRERALITLGIILLITVVASVAIGPVWIPPNKIAAMFAGNIVPINRVWSDSDEIIVYQIRLPRTIMGLLVGASLAVAGATMQGLFKNPMADPYIIGVSSGAGLGAALIISLTILSSLYIPVAAFVGAIITVSVVYSISRVGSKSSIPMLLLAGIAVTTFLSAMISFLIYISGSNLHQLIYWLMGGLWTSNWNYVFIALPVVLLGIIVLYVFARDLNVILLGEEPAQHLGVQVETIKKILLAVTSMMTAIAVSFSGIIGFVGLIVPHIMRILVGPDHRTLIPVSALCGGIFLIWADIIARTIISPSEIPIGVITAFIGAPFFIYLLRSRRRTTYL